MKLSSIAPIGGLVLLSGVLGATIYLPTHPFRDYQQAVVDAKLYNPGTEKEAVVSADPPMAMPITEGECYGVTVVFGKDAKYICVSQDDYNLVRKGDTVQFRERGGFHSNADIKVVSSTQ